MQFVLEQMVAPKVSLGTYQCVEYIRKVCLCPPIRFRSTDPGEVTKAQRRNADVLSKTQDVSQLAQKPFRNERPPLNEIISENTAVVPDLSQFEVRFSTLLFCRFLEQFPGNTSSHLLSNYATVPLPPHKNQEDIIYQSHSIRSVRSYRWVNTVQ